MVREGMGLKGTGDERKKDGRAEGIGDEKIGEDWMGL